MSFGDLKVQDLIYEDSSNNEITVVIADLATKVNPVFSGTVTVPTATAGDNSTKAASTAFVVASFAPKSAPTFAGTINGVDLILSGNLTVSGTQTIINTNVLQVEDKHIEIGKVSTPSDTTADGGGIILKASSDRTFLWVNATDAWTSSEHIQVASGKTFIGDGSTLTALNATNLASGTVPTARLGSGTAGSSNFLRGDGSWQTIATDKIEEGNTSVETIDTGSDGHVKVSIEGTERIRVSTNGMIGVNMTPQTTASNTYMLQMASGGTQCFLSLGNNTSGVGPLNGFVIGNDGGHAYLHNREATPLLLSTSDLERFRVGSAGQLGIAGPNYGSSGQVLTSGGSGAAPSWAAVPAGGNTFTAVANGNIANNKAVKLDTDGKVSQIATTLQARSNPSGQNDVAPDGNKARHLHCCNCGTDMILMLWYDDVTNRAEMAVAHSATATGGYSFGTQYSSLTTYNYWFKDMAYIGNNKVVLFTRRSGNICTAYVVTVNPSTKAITVGTGVDVTSNGEFNAVSWSPDNSKLLFAWRDTNSPYRGRLRHASVSGTSITLEGSEVYFPRISSANNINNIEIVYDTNVNHHVVAFIYSSRSKYGTWFSVDSSYTNPSTHTASDFLTEGIADGWQEQFGMDFDSSTNRIVIACQKQSESALRLVNGQCAANGDMSVNGTYTTGPSIGTSSQQGIHLVFDPLVGKSFLFFLNSSDYSQCVFLTTSSSSNSISQSSIVTIRNSQSNEVRGRSAIFDNGLGTALCMVRRENSGVDNFKCVTTIRVNGTDVIANLTQASQFVGYADQAYTNGQTATIKTYGNTVDTLSGMTTGSLYYLQQDGTVGTSSGFTSFATNTPLAGTALSATKLLIRDPLAKT